MSVTPRPASTVVLIDDSLRVYLTKRPKTMKFMGGYYVFPGGKVENEDFITGLDQRSHLNTPLDHSYYVAAARELFEEIGILLAKKGNEKSNGIEKEKEYRRLLTEGKLSFINMLQNEGMKLDVKNLNYLGQIITPDFNPVRFDTRFFLAKLPKHQTPTPHPTEIDMASWFHPEEALRNYENNEMQIAPPTIHILKTLLTYAKSGELSMPEYKITDYFSPSQIEQHRKSFSQNKMKG